MTFTCEAGVKLLSQVRGKKINQPFEEVSMKTLPPFFILLLSGARHQERSVDHIPLQRTTSLRGRRKLLG